jgi:predicted nucleic acid-binding protein
MTVIDSSMWLEYIAGSENGKKIYDLVVDYEEVILSVIIIYEVIKRVAITDNEEKAFKLMDYFRKFKIIDIDDELIISSIHYSLEYHLPLADSIIFATSIKYNASLITLDKHFQELPNVFYYPKI